MTERVSTSLETERSHVVESKIRVDRKDRLSKESCGFLLDARVVECSQGGALAERWRLNS